MKIYHTETQEDYDALMIELGRQRIETLEKHYWKEHDNQTVVLVRAIGRCGDSDRTDTTFGGLVGVLISYPRVPIIKYKAKADDKMRFTKENVDKLFSEHDKYICFSINDLRDEILKLDDTPEKAVVPKCFDEWFKEIETIHSIPDSAKTFALWKLCRQGFGCGFEDIRGKKIPYETDLGEWLFENKMLAIDAVINGYTIEPEQFYCIPLPHLETADGTKQYLTKSGAGNYFALSPCVGQKQRYTKEELEQVPEVYKFYAKLIEEEEE